MEFEPIVKWAVSAASGAVAIVLTINRLRTKLSSDSVQIRGHEAARTAYDTLEQDNERLREQLDEAHDRIEELTERADEAFRERNRAIVELAEVRAEAKLLRQHALTLETRIEAMQRRIGKLLGSEE